MLDSARLFRLLRFVGPLVILIWTLSYFTPSKSTYGEFLRQFKDEKKLFVADFLEHEIDGRFNGAPIADVCRTKKWTPGLILSCDPVPGGLGQVKNGHLHCIRIAMEMGAELILPEIVRRSETNIADLVPNDKGPRRGVPLDYFFDREQLNQSLSTHCPQMKLHSSLNDLYNVPSLLVPLKLSIQSLTSDFVNGTILANPVLLGRQIQDWLDTESPPNKRTYPLRVHLDTPTFVFPTAYDPPAFVTHFGRILRIREDARKLAGSALFNMAKMFDLKIDPRHGIKMESFLGVHLRTEKDVEGKFPDYETQAADYLSYIVQNKMPVVFLATGATGDNVTAFTERTKDFNCTTILKKDILEGEDLQILEKLSWDQRALIDYEIMLRAGLVAGAAESSFAWNLAMRRKNAYGASDTMKPLAYDGNIQWRDQYSIIYGKSATDVIEGKQATAQSMRLGIWP